MEIIIDEKWDWTYIRPDGTEQRKTYKTQNFSVFIFGLILPDMG